MLKPHPLNEEIYSDGADADLVESIKKIGVLHRVVVTPTYTIVSGHRRRAAAMAAGLKKIPVEVAEHLVDPNDVEEALILSNRSRARTNEQKAREIMHLERIESVRAEERMRRGVKDEDGGRSLDKAAEKLDMSATTAHRAKKVIEAIDDAVADGDEETAENLKDKMNKSVAGALRAVNGEEELKDYLDNAVPDHMSETFQNSRSIATVAFNVNKARTALEKLAESPGGERIQLAQVVADCKNLSEALQVAKPYAVCPMCKGDGCFNCDGLGWMHESRYNGVVLEEVEE